MNMQTLVAGPAQASAVPCHCRAPSVRPRTLAPCTRWSSQVSLGNCGLHAKSNRLGPTRAGKQQPGRGGKPKPQVCKNKPFAIFTQDGKEAPSIICSLLQQPEIMPDSIPTDEATEAADTEPATAPAADARYKLGLSKPINFGMYPYMFPATVNDLFSPFAAPPRKLAAKVRKAAQARNLQRLQRLKLVRNLMHQVL